MGHVKLYRYLNLSTHDLMRSVEYEPGGKFNHLFTLENVIMLHMLCDVLSVAVVGFVRKIWNLGFLWPDFCTSRFVTGHDKIARTPFRRLCTADKWRLSESLPPMDLKVPRFVEELCIKTHSPEKENDDIFRFSSSEIKVDVNAYAFFHCTSSSNCVGRTSGGIVVETTCTSRKTSL